MNERLVVFHHLFFLLRGPRLNSKYLFTLGSCQVRQTALKIYTYTACSFQIIRRAKEQKVCVEQVHTTRAKYGALLISHHEVQMLNFVANSPNVEYLYCHTHKKNILLAQVRICNTIA